MEVLVAGASGALGRPLVRALVAGGHHVHGLTRTPGHRELVAGLGAEPVVADAMDGESLAAAVRGLRLDGVIHVLTALKKLPTRSAHMEQTNRLRTLGTANLLRAARATGARRFVAESMHVGYGLGDWGDQVLTEATPFAPPGRNPGLERVMAAFRSLEDQVLGASREGWIEGVALRFGAFYGPEGGSESLVEALRRRRLPLLGAGQGVMHWIHLEDAAAATVAALEKGSPGAAYNVVDDQAVTWNDFLGLLAETFGAPRPRSLPRWLLSLAAPYAVEFMSTRIAVSNALARRELGWTPAAPTYMEGIAKLAWSLEPSALALGIQ